MQTKTAPLVELKNVKMNFKLQSGTSISVLESLNLSIHPGEIVALLGASGAGKSTTLRLMSGLARPSGGEVLSKGEPLSGLNRDISIVFQDSSLFPWLTVRGNLEAGPRARGVASGMRSEVDEFLELVGLTAFAGHYPHQLSGGMAQRAALARALINHPKMLLLDEPLGALDQFTRAGNGLEQFSRDLIDFDLADGLEKGAAWEPVAA